MNLSWTIFFFGSVWHWSHDYLRVLTILVKMYLVLRISVYVYNNKSKNEWGSFILHLVTSST